MMYKILLVLLTIIFVGCLSENYMDVGDIPFDGNIDDENFELCSEYYIKQYYVRKSTDKAPFYPGEKRGLENDILSKYKFPNDNTQNGYITIRFLINCNGESGRFRIEEMDYDYLPYQFNDMITNQLLEIVKSLKGWTPRKSRDRKFDFYQYLTFKIGNGQIVKILP